MNQLKQMTEHKGIKLTEVTTEIKVDATPEKVWNALSQYGNVATFHPGVELSVHGQDSKDEACLGAVRTCEVLDGKREVTLVERITEFEEGKFYRYEVFEWKNFPLKVMFFAFAIRTNIKGTTILSIVNNYRLNPGFITGLMKWKIKKLQRNILIGYKHYIETGEKKVPIKKLFTMERHENVFVK